MKLALYDIGARSVDIPAFDLNVISNLSRLDSLSVAISLGQSMFQVGWAIKCQFETCGNLQQFRLQPPIALLIEFVGLVALIAVLSF